GGCARATGIPPLVPPDEPRRRCRRDVRRLARDPRPRCGAARARRARNSHDGSACRAMCGITGILSLTDAPVEGALGAMTSALAHRGPDAEGEWSDGACALGHRRLAIIDLSPA